MYFKKSFTKSFTGKDWLHLGILLGFGLLLIRLSQPKGYVFGSETDWLCQHAALADYMRKQFLATGKLLPDFSVLGGGSNFYNLSYYGFLRPDVLLSYFLPQMPVITIIQGYAVFEILLGAELLYVWLRRKNLGDSSCLTAGMLYLCANCMFQAHRQIMFVNYLPFMILALMAVDGMTDTQYFPWFIPHTGLVSAFFMILIHSFYFFPACFAACSLYFRFRTQEPDLGTGSFGKLPSGKRRLWAWYLESVTAALCLAMIILLPTGLAILENKKDVKSSSLLQILTVNPTLDSLLYSAYGCGLTILCLYTLFLGIRRMRTRSFGLWLLCFLSFGIFYWILNGTLYVRPKCMIPFLPLILYLTALALDELWAGKIRHSTGLALLCGIPVAVQIVFLNPQKKMAFLMIMDWVIVVLFAVSEKLRTAKRGQTLKKKLLLPQCLLLCLLPALLFLAKAETEKFVPREKAAMFSEEVFTAAKLKQLCQTSNKRLDVLSSPLTNTNYAAFGQQQKSTLYSSVSNSNYNHLYYDILKMPVNIRNRVAMTGDANPIQEYLMGVGYLLTSSDKIPAGYETLEEKENLVLAENKNVLPLAYGSTALMDEQTFDALSYPENLDTLANRTIVPDKGIAGASSQNTSDAFLTKQSFPAYHSRMTPYPVPKNFFHRKRTSEETSLTKMLPRPLTPSMILLLSFDVNYSGWADISVTVNGIKNCLSGKGAPYPNHNTTFTYMISSNQPLTELDIRFSKGNYRISNVSAYTLPLSALAHPGVVPFKSRETGGKELLNGSITMEQDGYFVTSFAFSHGYQAVVDGHKVTPAQVNKAFVGFPIKKGTHEVVLTFHAPGKTAGLVISLLAACYLFVANLAVQFLINSRKKSCCQSHKPSPDWQL